MNDEKDISGVIHHLSRQLANSSNQKWTDIGYPDISTTHVSILLRIGAMENNHYSLAKQLGISRQAISKLNHELIENGYLAVSPTENNRNSETLSLTKKGQQFLDDFKTVNQDLEKALIKIFTKPRFQQYKFALLMLDEYFKAR